MQLDKGPIWLLPITINRRHLCAKLKSRQFTGEYCFFAFSQQKKSLFMVNIAILFSWISAGMSIIRRKHEMSNFQRVYEYYLRVHMLHVHFSTHVCKWNHRICVVTLLQHKAHKYLFHNESEEIDHDRHILRIHWCLTTHKTKWSHTHKYYFITSSQLLAICTAEAREA